MNYFNYFNARGKRLVLVVAVVLTVHASVAASQQENIECYQCNYKLGKEDTENCTRTGPWTPTRRCEKNQICWTVSNYEEVSRQCWNNRSEVAWINKDLYYGKAYYTVATSCKSSLCNHAPYAVPTGRERVTCYKYAKSAPSPVNSLSELCAREEGGKCETETCFGSCYTKIFTYDNSTYVDLHCEQHLCDAAYTGCCESDLCNSDVTVTQKIEIERKPIRCYTCDDFQNPNCRQMCSNGSCIVTLTIEANGTISKNERGCNSKWSAEHSYYNSSSIEQLTIDKMFPKDYKSLYKVCFTDFCNSDMDIHDTYESLEEEFKSGSGRPSTSLVKPSAGSVTTDWILPSAGATLHESRLNLLLLLCTMATVLMESRRALFCIR